MVKLPRYILLKIYILLKYCKKIKRSIYSHHAHHEPPPSNHERWTRGARTQLEFTARDYKFTTWMERCFTARDHEFTTSVERSI